MIGRREFMTKTFKAIVGGTLILPIPKVLYSFPTDIVLPRLYNISAYDHIDFKYLASGLVRIFPERLDRVDGEEEVVELLRKLKIYDKYSSWHFHEANTPPDVSRAFIWSKDVEADMARYSSEISMDLAYDIKYNVREVR